MQIPTQTSQTVFTDVPLRGQDIQANPAEFGALQGAAAQRVGQQLGQAAQETQQTALLAQQFANENASTQALNSFQSNADDYMNGNAAKGIVGFTTLNGRDALDQAQNYQGRVMQAFNQARDSLNPAAQRQFDMMGHWALRSTLGRMGEWTAHQQNNYNLSQARAGVDLAVRSTLTNADDPDAWDRGMAAVQDASGQYAKLAGLGPEATEDLRQQDLGQLYVQRTEQLVQRNPIEAADFYQKNIGAIPPSQRFRIGQLVKTTTDAQYARTDGQAAYQAAIGQPVDNSPLPKDENASFVKPYDQGQIGNIVSLVKKASPYDPIIDKVAKQYNVSPTELKLRLAAESGLNAKAVSPAGAVGIAQITPATAKTLGIDPNDPEQAIDGAARLMVKAGDTVGSTNYAQADRLYYGGNVGADGPNTNQYVDNLRAVRQALYGPQAPAPMTSAELEAREGDVLQQARAAAERRRPGDMVYQDQVVAAAQSQFARNLQALRGQEYADANSVLGAVVKGGIQTPSELPPQLLTVYSRLTPQNQEAVQAEFHRNMLAASGQYTPSNPGLFNSLQSRLYLAPGDPNRINDPTQILRELPQGLSYADGQRLISELKESNDPSLSPFLRQANQVKLTAMRMLQTSLNATALTHPELTQEAAYRFDFALDQNIAALRKAGKDPTALFDPTSPDYVLKPARVLSFLPSESAAAGAAARGPGVATAGTATPPRQPGESAAAYLARVQFQGNP